MAIKFQNGMVFNGLPLIVEVKEDKVPTKPSPTPAEKPKAPREPREPRQKQLKPAKQASDPNERPRMDSSEAKKGPEPKSEKTNS